MSRDLTNHPAFNQPEKEPFLKRGDWPELSQENCSTPTEAQLAEAMNACAKKLRENQIELPPEYWKLINDNMEELMF